MPLGIETPHVRQRRHLYVPLELDAERPEGRGPERRRREPFVAEDEDLGPRESLLQGRDRAPEHALAASPTGGVRVEESDRVLFLIFFFEV